MRHKIHIKIKNRNKQKTTFTMRIGVRIMKSRSYEYWQFIKNAGTVTLSVILKWAPCINEVMEDIV